MLLQFQKISIWFFNIFSKLPSKSVLSRPSIFRFLNGENPFLVHAWLTWLSLERQYSRERAMLPLSICEINLGKIQTASFYNWKHGTRVMYYLWTCSFNCPYHRLIGEALFFLWNTIFLMKAMYQEGISGIFAVEKMAKLMVAITLI